jgi:hypothetical protein
MRLYNDIVKPETRMNISPFLAINHSCDEALRWATQQLSQVGLRPVQTFDLHTARLALHDCPCPNHGTNECDCQMIVMLVYGTAYEPVTLILHGNAGQTWVSIADSPHPKSDVELVNAIQRALEVKTLESNIP